MLARAIGLERVVVGRPHHESRPFAAAVERDSQPGELIERRGHDITKSAVAKPIFFGMTAV